MFFSRIYQNGFTLIEVIVAIGIFSVLSFGSYRILNGILGIQDRLSLHSEEIREISNAVRIIESDFRQIVDRKIIDDDGNNLAAYVTNTESYGKDVSLIEFTRQGARNPLLSKRSEIIRIGYGYLDEIDEDTTLDFEFSEITKKDPIQNGYLVRYVWPVLDRGNDNKPVIQLLMKDISSLEIEYLDRDKNWSSEWPPLSQNGVKKSDIPYAVKVTINDKKIGEIERVFSLRSFPIKE